MYGWPVASTFSPSRYMKGMKPQGTPKQGTSHRSHSSFLLLQEHSWSSTPARHPEEPTWPQHPALSSLLKDLPALHATICTHFQAAAHVGTGFWVEGGGKNCHRLMWQCAKQKYCSPRTEAVQCPQTCWGCPQALPLPSNNLRVESQLQNIFWALQVNGTKST